MKQNTKAATRADWITGDEIMQTGILPPDLGKACYEGTLKAYVPELGDKRQIMEFSQLSCWPKYPSPLVNHRDYIKPASSPFWDWDEILGIPKLRQEISDIEHQLNEIEGQGQQDSKLRDKFIALQRNLRIATQPNYNARPQAVSDIAKASAKTSADVDYEKYVLEAIWELMKTEAVYLIDDVPIPEGDLPSRTFYFYYEMYEQYRKSECEENGEKYDLLSFVGEYKNRLSKMWFRRKEVEKNLGCQLSEKHNIPKLEEPQKTSNSRIPFPIDSSLWVEKDARTVFSDMRKRNFLDEIIAYVLVELMGETKTDAGRLFYEKKIISKKIKEPDLGTFQRKINNLLKKCAEKYTIILRE